MKVHHTAMCPKDGERPGGVPWLDFTKQLAQRLVKLLKRRAQVMNSWYRV
jgi:hypothetical protein